MARDGYDPYPDTDTTSFRFQVPSDEWDQWTDTVPRSLALYERLFALIRADTAAGGVARGDVDGFDAEDEQMVRLLSSRVHHRAQRAITALDNDNRDRALEELETITSISAELEG